MTVVFNDKKVKDPAELVVEHAENLANQVTSRSEATKSQMRRFYQEYLKLRQRIKSAPNADEAYEKNKVAIKMLISKAKYATGRQNVKVSPVFVEWFEKNIKAINSAQDVETFGQYFEAFMGYFYARQSNNQRGGR